MDIFAGVQQFDAAAQGVELVAPEPATARDPLPEVGAQGADFEDRQAMAAQVPFDGGAQDARRFRSSNTPVRPGATVRGHFEELAVDRLVRQV
jgi:hypothetical protein